MKPLPLALVCLFFLAPAFAQEKVHLELKSPFASYVEADFPFFSQVVDAREFGGHPEAENLTPRGIVIPAGGGFFGCFDPDLLRWSLLWKSNEDGEYLSMVSMAPGSYRLPNRKAGAGQKDLPKPLGIPVLAMPLRPGVALGDAPRNEDPRDRGKAEPEELGLGPISDEQGRFSGIRLIQGGLQLEYTVGDTLVKERLSSEGDAIIRLIQVAPHQDTLHFRTGRRDSDWLSLKPSTETTVHRLAISGHGEVAISSGGDFPKEAAPEKRWKKSVKTGPGVTATEEVAWAREDFPLPIPNPWKRNVRISDLDFFPDGRAAFLTFDGDVWIAEGIRAGSPSAEWRRFASGLHEPQSFVISDGQVIVYDRNGIVRLHDTDGNGEADWYENVSNVVAQSAETREFPMSLIALPDGGFYIAHGGQIGSSIGKYNGTVIKIAPDGRQFEVIATGLRQPYLGYDPVTGILTASDQQGNWKPGTPIYRIEPGRYFGFQPEKFKGDVTHPAPIDPAEVWIPHFINQSGASQVWMRQTGKAPVAMGALNDCLVHIGYNRPEIFKVYLDPEGKQGAVRPLLADFPSGLLNGRIHPLDGTLYLTGFQIWGSSGTAISGIYRVYPGKVEPWLPRDVVVDSRGLLITFDDALTPELVSELGRYSADRWNYKQTHEYGSGNYRLDGEPGQEPLPILSAKLSKDAKSLFLGIADMKPSDTLRFTYRLPVPGVEQVENLYFTIREFHNLDLRKQGFADNEVDLTPRADLTGGAEVVEPTAELGREVAMRYGCIACHATGDPSVPSPPPAADAGDAKVAVGPPWAGLWESKREFTDGTILRKVDEVYLRESILDPARRVALGYEMEKSGVGMPSYLGVLKDHEIDSLILYIKTLEGPKKAKKK